MYNKPNTSDNPSMVYNTTLGGQRFRQAASLQDFSRSKVQPFAYAVYVNSEAVHKAAV